MRGRQQVHTCKLQDFPWSGTYWGGFCCRRGLPCTSENKTSPVCPPVLLTCFSPDCRLRAVCVCVGFFHLPSCVYLAGIRSWDTNLIDCNLDQELKLFVSRHSARFSADVKGKPELEEALIAQLQSDDDCSCICKPNLIHTFFPPPSSLPPPPALSLSARVEKYRCVPGAATAHLKF